MKKLGVVLTNEEEQLFSSLILQHLNWADHNQFIKAKQVLDTLPDIFNASPLSKPLIKKYA